MRAAAFGLWCSTIRATATRCTTSFQITYGIREQWPTKHVQIGRACCTYPTQRLKKQDVMKKQDHPHITQQPQAYAAKSLLPEELETQ
ncbi:hypothetical protein OG21DRAFT_1518146 [Imleria badia]|nr:hypothetical protein OG21DRAFT_1518146 [Imleria badia]